MSWEIKPPAWHAQISLTLADFHLNVEVGTAGRPVALVGPNGAGKTTLLRALAGALRPQSGRIQVGVQVLFDSARRVDQPMERRRVGYLPQGAGLFPHLTAEDNVAFGMHRAGTNNGTRRQAARQLLTEMGVGELAQRRPDALSGGERQRVALARALAVEPALLLLDEPLSGVDVAARRRLRSFLVQRLQRQGAAPIVVTHDPRDLVALDPEVFVLHRGAVAQSGSVAELRRSPANDFVAELFA